jgi:hypothetical protein
VGSWFQFINVTWLETIQPFKKCAIRILCSRCLKVIGDYRGSNTIESIREPKKMYFCKLTELFCSKRYTGNPRKYIPAALTLPAFTLSSCRKLHISQGITHHKCKQKYSNTFDQREGHKSKYKFASLIALQFHDKYTRQKHMDD